MGGYKSGKGMSDILGHSAKVLWNTRIGLFGATDNDGIFYTDEIKFETFDKDEKDAEFVSYHVGDMNSDYVELTGVAHEELRMSGFEFCAKTLDKLDDLKSYGSNN